jgi:hypothetical protein
VPQARLRRAEVHQHLATLGCITYPVRYLTQFLWASKLYVTNFALRQPGHGVPGGLH